jgi:hypothetical protein
MFCIEIGAMASLSICAIPAVLRGGASADVMLRQWYIVYNTGKAIPMTAVASALSYWAAAYGQWTRGLEWRGFAVGGALAAAAVPFTMTVIMPTNRELSAAANSKAKTMSDARVRSLISTWTKLNVVRVFLPLSGAVLGLYSLLA